jgi:hypothetical protein
MTEFECAWTHNLSIKKRRLIVIKLDEVFEGADSDTPYPQQLDSNIWQHNTTAGDIETNNCVANDELDLRKAVDDLKMFLQTHTYIDRCSEDWWQKLLYAMPRQSLITRQ